MASVETPDSGGQQRGHSKKKWMAIKRVGFRIDMTPYVDVIMLLLTFFIMTTTLNQPQVMQINLPKGDDSSSTVKVPMNNVVFIRVSDKGNIAISKGKEDGTEEAPVPVAFDKLKDYLTVLGTANKDMIMILKFDRKGKYNYMVHILDEINKAPIDKRYSFSKWDDNDTKVSNAVGG